jgi:hypothetical protein
MATGVLMVPSVNKATVVKRLSEHVAEALTLTALWDTLIAQRVVRLCIGGVRNHFADSFGEDAADGSGAGDRAYDD